MKLDSNECKGALRTYKVENDTEELAVKVLLARDEDVVDISGILDMGNKQIDELAEAIRKIRNDIGIEDWA
jgi:hypothetical protein